MDPAVIQAMNETGAALLAVLGMLGAVGLVIVCHDVRRFLAARRARDLRRFPKLPPRKG